MVEMHFLGSERPVGLPTLNFKKSTGRFDYRNPCLTLNGGNAFFRLGATSEFSDPEFQEIN